jgi:hypothetical protein
VISLLVACTKPICFKVFPYLTKMKKHAIHPYLLFAPCPLPIPQNAVLALGIIGAGTNNARLAGMLRNLASYYYKEPTLLFLVRRKRG